jgi:hypothetical protein
MTVLRAVVIIVAAYILTGIWIVWRGFREHPVRAPLFVSQYRQTEKRFSYLVGVALHWLPATIFAATLPGTRLRHLKREAGYWLFFIALIVFGFLLLRS